MAPCEEIELSISYSGERVVVAVALGAPVGVDVERVEPGRAASELAAAGLTPTEQSMLAELPAAEYFPGVFRYWTRKEAILKATGHGLTVSPTGFAVTAPNRPPALVSWPRHSRLERELRLVDLTPGPGYTASLAMLAHSVTVQERDASYLMRTLSGAQPGQPLLA